MSELNKSAKIYFIFKDVAYYTFLIGIGLTIGYYLDNKIKQKISEQIKTGENLFLFIPIT